MMPLMNEERCSLHRSSFIKIDSLFGVPYETSFAAMSIACKQAGPAASYTTEPSLKIGRYMAMTKPPISTPKITMISGSIRLDSEATASSTSFS